MLSWCKLDTIQNNHMECTFRPEKWVKEEKSNRQSQAMRTKCKDVTFSVFYDTVNSPDLPLLET